MAKKGVLGLMVLVVAAMGVAGQSQIITNGSFEAETFDGYGYASGATITGWTYYGSVGIYPSSTGSITLGNSLPIPDGDQALFIQTSASTSWTYISQDVTLSAGLNYTLSYWASVRATSSDLPYLIVKLGDQTLDEHIVYGPEYRSGALTSYTQYIVPFTVATDGTYTLKFINDVTQMVTSTWANDATLLLDDIQITATGPAVPVFSPSEKYIFGPTMVTISPPATGGTLYYTMDGTTPTTASPSAVDMVEVSVSPGMTLSAMVYWNGSFSDVNSVTYEQRGIVLNGSFEVETFGGYGYASGGTITGWTCLSGIPGIVPSSTGSMTLGNSLPIPDGDHVLFCQSNGTSRISQDVTLSTGALYMLSYYESVRVYSDTPYLTVTLGDQTLGSPHEVLHDELSYIYRPVYFTVPSDGVYTLTFASECMNDYGIGDATILLDDIRIDEITSIPAPAFSPEFPEIRGSKSVNITSDIPGAIIYYTTNGTIPTTASSSGTSSINVTVTPGTTLKAMVVLEGVGSSDVKSVTYEESPIVMNGSFEAETFYGYGYGYALGETITGWSYSGNAGISPSSTGNIALSNSFAIPEGNHVFFLQTSSTGSLSQSVPLSAGTEYTLSYYESVRSHSDTPNLTVKVGTQTLDSHPVSKDETAYVHRTATFTVPSNGNYTLTFSITALDDYGIGDATILLDNIQISSVNAPVLSPGPESGFTYYGISEPTSVTMTSSTSGASIYYTTDGSTPTVDSTSYTGAIEVNESITLKAVAYTSADGYSIVTSVRYVKLAANRGKTWIKNHPFQINAVAEREVDMQQYKNVGFSSYMATNLQNANGPETMFGAASAVGLGWHWFYRWSSELPVAQFISKLTSSVENYPGFLGVSIGDESDQSLYPAVAQKMLQVKDLFPDAVVYSGLPVYQDNTTFRTNLDLAISTMDLDVVMFDQYPFNGGSTDSDFYDNLAIVRERALAAGIPYWNWLQGHGWDADGYSYRQDPSESEVRLQAFMSLAYGYSGLSYWTYAGTYSPYTNAILNSSGTLSSIGEAVEGAIEEIKNIGNVTKDLTSTGVFYVTASGESQPIGTIAWTPQNGYTISSVTVNSGSKGFVIGLFQGDDGKKYFMVVNGNHAAYTSAADTAATVTITFDSSVNKITRINRTTGESEEVALTNHELSNYSLPGGTGDLFCLTVESERIPGDANGDNKVDVGDLGILAANYGGTNKTWSEGDFNNDGNVDVGDLGILAANYGTSGSSFETDYAKVFGTTSVDEDTDTESTLCSSLGLSLVAGLAMLGLMIVKLEE
jgi:hypothetical protein